ncbi:MAG: acyltransferase [Rhodoferax sp.]|uniref:acyltransferase family protein n=1 Tax=Rhodoferax sp. TaxID=50421 RepID=UPI002609ECE6|nr:acyltransferase [Rhodoferax sp.]MDD2881513.1 acyltransferase [Rhodoferax sp.]
MIVDPVGLMPAIVALIVAVATSLALTRIFGAPPIQGRFVCIDGLRGYLAFFVFLAHSSVWYFYLHTGKWVIPPSFLYTHFGQSSVALFFMITGFLFFGKLLNGRTRPIDWLQLFVSRLLRLTPLYFIVIILLFFVVVILSNGVLIETSPKLLRNIVAWLSFTIFGAPDLNGIKNTWIIVAGVTWSLPYEWKFYFSLPLIAIIIGLRPPIIYIGLSVIFLWYFEVWLVNFHYLSFLSGIFAALIVRSEVFCRLAKNRFLSLVAIGCLAAVLFFPTAYELAPLVLLTVFFVLVAAGNSLFGVLIGSASRTLGELAYGIYLLQGISLFLLFNFVLGLPAARALSAAQHWMVICGLTPILITVCFFVFRYIEHPFMQQTPTLTAWLRSRWSRAQAAM